MCGGWCCVGGTKKKFSFSAFSHPMLDYKGRYPLLFQYDYAGEATTVFGFNISKVLNGIFAKIFNVNCVGYPHVVGKQKQKFLVWKKMWMFLVFKINFCCAQKIYLQLCTKKTLPSCVVPPCELFFHFVFVFGFFPDYVAHLAFVGIILVITMLICIVVIILHDFF